MCKLLVKKYRILQFKKLISLLSLIVFLNGCYVEVKVKAELYTPSAEVKVIVADREEIPEAEKAEEVSETTDKSVRNGTTNSTNFDYQLSIPILTAILGNLASEELITSVMKLITNIL